MIDPHRLGKWFVFLVVTISPPLLSRWAPGVLSESTALTLGVATCFAAMAVSTYVVVGHARRISLGHGALAGLGAFTSGVLTARGPQVAFVTGLVAAAAVGAAGGLLLGLVAKRLRGTWLAVATLAFSFALDQSLFRARFLSQGAPGLDVPRPRIGSFVFSLNADYLSIAVLVLALLLWSDAHIKGSDIGRAIRAAGETSLGAQAVGVNAERMIAHAFVISGAYAGLSGATFGHLLGHVRAETFSYDLLSLPLLAIVVVGGMRSRFGVVLAALGYVLLPRALGVAATWGPAILAVSLILVVSLNRDGIDGLLHALVRRTPPYSSEEVPMLHKARALIDRDSSMVASGLQIRELSVRVGSDTILDHLTLTVAANSTVALVGANGAGKSELLDAICGLQSNYDGTILFGDRAIDGLRFHERASIGMSRTFEQVGLAGSLTVLENLLLAQHSLLRRGFMRSVLLQVPGTREDERSREAARAAADVIGLASRLDHRTLELSYGRRRILELACATLSGAGLLLLDEPSSGLDEPARDAVRAILESLRHKRTILLVEHDVEFAAAVADQVYLVEGGRISAPETS